MALQVGVMRVHLALILIFLAAASRRAHASPGLTPALPTRHRLCSPHHVGTFRFYLCSFHFLSYILDSSLSHVLYPCGTKPYTCKKLRK